jgi:hypothetical protein
MIHRSKKSTNSVLGVVAWRFRSQRSTCLQRNLIYTGTTRGKKLVLLVGQKKALGIAVRNDRPQRRYSGLLSRLRFVSYQKSSSGFFQQARNPDQNYRAHKRDNDGTYHAASRPDSQKSKDPATHNAAEDSENDVHEHAVATTLHNLTS